MSERRYCKQCCLETPAEPVPVGGWGRATWLVLNIALTIATAGVWLIPLLMLELGGGLRFGPAGYRCSVCRRRM